MNCGVLTVTVIALAAIVEMLFNRNVLKFLKNFKKKNKKRKPLVNFTCTETKIHFKGVFLMA